MSTLRGFLAENALAADNVKFVASKRFLDDEGKPAEWEIKCITSTEDEALRKASQKRQPVPGRRGQYTHELDANLYMGRLAAQCTVAPNLNDAELQNSYGVMGADSVLKAMLTPGEYAEYLIKVQEANGFDVTFEDAVDEAKN